MLHECAITNQQKMSWGVRGRKKEYVMVNEPLKVQILLFDEHNSLGKEYIYVKERNLTHFKQINCACTN